KSFTVRNLGTATMTGISIAQTGTAVPQITSTGTTCGSTLTVGSSCTFTVRYTPTSASARVAAYYRVTSSGDDPVVTVRGGPRLSVHEAFVDFATIQFLNRGATSAELGTLSAALDAGSRTRRSVVTSMAGSDEWIEAVVQDLYQD